MRLQRVRVQNYRSIMDSGDVEIEERVTVLIGKNERGKTTFLKALASFNPTVAYSPSDLPNHLRPQLEEQEPETILVVTAWFELDAADKKALGQLTGLTLEDAATLRIKKDYSQSMTYEPLRTDGSSLGPLEDLALPELAAAVNALRGHAESLNETLAPHAERVPTFASSLESARSHIAQFTGSDLEDKEQLANLVKTLGTALKGLPGQDVAIQEEIAERMTVIQGAQKEVEDLLDRDPYTEIDRLLPVFVYHSTALDRIPNSVSIADFTKNPEATSKGMANLCAVAGLSMQKIKDLAATPDSSKRESYEDHYRGTISGGINEFWTQEKYTVHFRIDRETLSVSIADGTYSPRIAPSERSDGFQWYLSFYSAVTSEVSSMDRIVLLLDNPGLEFHADGQRDIKRFLEEKLPSGAQVIYVTHSPAMIDPYRLEQVRHVDLKIDVGTTVGRLRIKTGEQWDLLEPVRSAIGASLATSLIFDEWNVLVEGAADRPLLEAALEVNSRDSKRRILVNGSTAENGELLAMFYSRSKLPYVVLVDADSSGRGIRAKLTAVGVDVDKFVDLAELFPERKGADFELEDVMSPGFYAQAVASAYPDQPVDPPQVEASGKRTRYYDERFREQYKLGFNKRRVADAGRRLLLDGKADEATREALSKIVGAIVTNLMAQQVGQEGDAAGGLGVREARP